MLWHILKNCGEGKEDVSNEDYKGCYVLQREDKEVNSQVGLDQVV